MLKRLRRGYYAVSAKLPTSYNAALRMALAIAVLWWAVTVIFRAANLATVWYDQGATFTQLGHHIDNPYQVSGFVNPPWAAILLAPFAFLPLPIAVLVQLCLYFVIMTAVIFKFGGNAKTVLLVLLSYIALDSALELNIDWLVCLGLLVLPSFSGPFLLIKPQDAFGYWLTLKWHDFIRAVAVLTGTIGVSLILWPNWPVKMIQAIQTNTLGHFYNLAPAALMPWPIAIAIGLILSWFGFKRHDPFLAIWGWIFFAPYLTFYALLLPFALLAIRYPRFALLFSVTMWLIFGGIVAAGVVAHYVR
jgi:hypothetical protein